MNDDRRPMIRRQAPPDNRVPQPSDGGYAPRRMTYEDRRSAVEEWDFTYKENERLRAENDTDISEKRRMEYDGEIGKAMGEASKHITIPEERGLFGLEQTSKADITKAYVNNTFMKKTVASGKAELDVYLHNKKNEKLLRTGHFLFDQVRCAARSRSAFNRLALTKMRINTNISSIEYMFVKSNSVVIIKTPELYFLGIVNSSITKF